MSGMMESIAALRGGGGIGMRVTETFFDRKAVTDRLDKAKLKVLRKFGGTVRKIARRSIKKPGFVVSRKKKRQELIRRGKRTEAWQRKVSNPGRPPLSQTGLLKEFLFFGYDEESVVIGPTKLNRKGDNVPEILEYGGTTRRGIRIKARPYMAPAFAKVKPKLPAMWANSVKKN